MPTTTLAAVTDDVAANLTERDRAILDFEGSWWLTANGSPKFACIRDHLDMSPTSYYAALERLIGDAAAIAYNPLVVRRLRRRRVDRRRAQFESAADHQHR